MNPRIRYSPALRLWCCFGSGVQSCASTPKIAYHFWREKVAEIEVRQLVERM